MTSPHSATCKLTSAPTRMQWLSLMMRTSLPRQTECTSFAAVSEITPSSGRVFA